MPQAVMPLQAPPQGDVGSFVELLTETRTHTLLLVAPLTEEDVRSQHDPLMSPILWDLGHIASFERLWLLHNSNGPVEFSEMPGLYDPFENPRATRDRLPLPTLPALLREMADTRGDVLEHLRRDGLDWESPLLRDGYLFQMVAQHEQQHGETILQTLKLKRGEPYRAPRAITPPPGAPVPADADGMVRFGGGRVPIGTRDRTAAYDNERGEHEVELAPFRIDAAPVTNAAFQEFMREGGYRERRLWSEAGRAWLDEAGVEAPKYWARDGDAWVVREFDEVHEVPADHPVCHVSFHEAEAFARWAGKRLPTEQEWETAASWEPESGEKHLYPWGDEPPTTLDANLDQLAFSTAPVGAYPRNVSPLGCYGMIGDVWEWTASPFVGYPGFEPFPYREYSEVFFGDEYRVLRGGSWATRGGAVRNTFRNWDYPIRRQIYAGFRCAKGD
ncbi:MAG TPA: ergothioneine biosynthesis protein EgtB [Longimicrobiaceae bacterium]|nr:ergothioneine biosynthesis protein EgtB [Longimicrobiaceae bacterium]